MGLITRPKPRPNCHQNPSIQTLTLILSSYNPQPPLTLASVLCVQLVALKEVSSTECALVYSMEPVLGAGFAFLALGERWGPTGWLGAAIIVASSLTGQILGGDPDSGAAKSAE